MLHRPFDLRQFLVRPATRALAFYLRHGPSLRLRYRLWRDVAQRRINWRGLQLLSRTRFGTLMLCRSDDAVQSRILYFGVWEPHVSAVIASRLGPGDLFVDVGANVGYYSLLAAAHGAEVVAIEASPSIHADLEANIARNPRLTSRIRTCHAAVSDHSGELIIYRARNDNLGASTTLAERALQGEMTAEARVPASRLADLVGLEERSRTRLVKIDIEGGEYPVLRDILTHRKDWPAAMEIVVEVSADALAAHGLTPDSLLQRIRQAGYRTLRIRNSYDMSDYLDRPSPVPPQEIDRWPPGERLCDLLLSPRELS
ncbi:MAG: FkbM family methyltransferase [Alphaproteobacteria bacterium]|nr:MAG: FkbM family methyltransferase [Alphaproteobacteria bacterium]